MLDNPIVNELMQEHATCPNCASTKPLRFTEFADYRLAHFLDENFKLGGTKFQYISDEEVADMIIKHSETKTKDYKERKKNKLLDPYIHKGNITYDSKNVPNIDALRQLISKPPRNLLSTRNTKMAKGENIITRNIGIPALHGLAVDKETGEFALINTCPSAGSCKLFCYAMKGSYIQWKGLNMAQMQKLNLLLNDPIVFAKRLSAEILNEKYKAEADGKGLVIRWHDSGDFFSNEYLDIGFEVAKEHPDVTFTAYTKVAEVFKADAPENFIFTYSYNSAIPRDKDKISPEDSKIAVEVPRELFSDIMTNVGPVKGFLKPSYVNILKDRLYQKYGALYNITRNNIITYDEMLKTKPRKNLSKANKKAVIVTSNDGDESTQRTDVRITFNLMH